MSRHQLDADGMCVFSDLPPDSCAAPRCRPDLRTPVEDEAAANQALLPSQVKRRTIARHVSIVACGHHALPSTQIALGPDGWICAECDPGAPAEPYEPPYVEPVGERL
ncbi:hypothetical protein [Nocardioides nanhaiensis]|uniref:Uncharacterized protein n=1 Tax=Nocardioides nanhaiensis TaxID=1476871 RepID=A0ABP8W3F6_9ACTN